MCSAENIKKLYGLRHLASKEIVRLQLAVKAVRYSSIVFGVGLGETNCLVSC